MHSACQHPECRCTGFRLEKGRKKDIEQNYFPNLKELCRASNCSHYFGKLILIKTLSAIKRKYTYIFFIFVEDHISDINDITEDQINELLGAVVDVENLHVNIDRVKEIDNKKVYQFLYSVS